MSFKRDLEEIKQKKEQMMTSKFNNAEMLYLLWETKPEVVEHVLPPPLEPTDQPIVLAFIAHYPTHSFGVGYYEAALLLRCQYNGVVGNYFLAMPLTDDRATFAGREVFGFPKKIANVYLERKDDEVYGYSERLGTKNIEVNVKMTGKFNDQEGIRIFMRKILPKKGKNTVNYLFKHFPAPNKEGFDYNPWLVTQETKLNIDSWELGEAEVKLNSTIHDPWAEIEIVKLYGAIYMKSSNEMFPGKKVAEVDPDEFLPYSFIKWDWY
jgi:acetoacetate decarboxylase